MLVRTYGVLLARTVVRLLMEPTLTDAFDGISGDTMIIHECPTMLMFGVE